MKRVILFFGFLMFLGSIECSAQQVSSFEQLQLLVKRGDNIYVTDAEGKTTKGRIADLSPSTLGLTVKGARRDLLQTDVLEIKQWRSDSLRNGALIGAGVGASVIGFPAISYCNNEGGCNPGDLIGVFAIGAGIGAAIGVGIDALIPAKQTIFWNPNRSATRKFQVRPILNRSGKGVKVAFSF